MTQNGFYDYQLQEGLRFCEIILVSIKLLINGFSSKFNQENGHIAQEKEPVKDTKKVTGNLK